MITTYAFELETGAPASTARRCIEKYMEQGTETVSRFPAKSRLARRALPGLRKGGA